MRSVLNAVFRFALIGATFVLAAPVVAQQPAPGAPPAWMGQLSAYMKRPEHLKQVAFYTREFEKLRKGRCDAVEVVQVSPLFLGPIQFDSTGEPTGGTWREQIFVNRCGERVVHNVLFEASPGKIVPKGMFPGETRAPLVAQNSIALEMQKFVAHHHRMPDCRVFIIMNTHIASPPQNAEPDGELWREKWTVKRCDRFEDVMVDMKSTRGRLENFRFSQG